ncbi:hypothetical protein NIASO_18930 [Niabella soli DSM 19437]|uniref:Uncharacterized protein n=1 Tax=Niabella soli DSM 19437 TaxID=929713 RepID=W0F4M1_9BACT|nr:hypothetical protein NIASO_18930 [Niabella soli DSM 19437]
MQLGVIKNSEKPVAIMGDLDSDEYRADCFQHLSTRQLFETK